MVSRHVGGLKVLLKIERPLLADLGRLVYGNYRPNTDHQR
jgi:hypothetical protein